MCIFFERLQVGFSYGSVVEYYLTGFMLNCNGWTSVFCEPSRPQFLGSATTNLNGVLIQGPRWYSGLFENGINRFCPLTYGLSKMPLLQSLCLAWLTYFPLYCFPLWCFATIPQLCLLNGIPLYPKVTTIMIYLTYHHFPFNLTFLYNAETFLLFLFFLTGFRPIFHYLFIHLSISSSKTFT